MSIEIDDLPQMSANVELARQKMQEVYAKSAALAKLKQEEVYCCNVIYCKLYLHIYKNIYVCKIYFFIYL